MDRGDYMCERLPALAVDGLDRPLGSLLLILLPHLDLASNKCCGENLVSMKFSQNKFIIYIFINFITWLSRSSFTSWLGHGPGNLES